MTQSKREKKIIIQDLETLDRKMEQNNMKSEDWKKRYELEEALESYTLWKSYIGNKEVLKTGF